MRKIIFIVVVLCMGTTYAQNFDWATKLESDEGITIHDVVTDSNDDSIVVGSFKGTVDFNYLTTSSWYTRTAIDEDFFVMKIDQSGYPGWLRVVSGAGIQRANSIAISPNGNLQITGGFEGNAIEFDLNATNPTSKLTSNGAMDVFVLTLSAWGQYIEVLQIGGTGEDEGMAIVSNGHNFVTGYFSGTNSLPGIDFAPLPGEISYTPGDPSTYIHSKGGTDIFTVRLRETGSLAWAKISGSPGQDKGEGIALAPQEGVYVTGHFQGGINFNAGFPGPQILVGGPLFLQRISMTGRSIWAKRIQGQFDTHNNCIASSPDRRQVYLTGKFEGSKNFGSPGIPNVLNAWGGNDIFILKHTQFGNLIWAKQIAGFSEQEAHAIYVNECSEVYIGGSVGDLTDLNPSPSSPYFVSANDREGFVVRLRPNGSFVWGQTVNATTNADIRSLAVDTKGGVIAVGSFVQGIEPSGLSPITASSTANGRIAFTTKIKKPIQVSIMGPADESTGTNCPAEFICPVTNGIAYQWQIENTPGIWTDVTLSGATSRILHFTAGNFYDNKQFRCVVSFPCQPDVPSPPATFTLLPPQYTCKVSENNSMGIREGKYIAYPNPFNTELTLRTNTEKEEELLVSIYDVSGRVVYSSNEYKTNDVIYLNPELQAGVYTVRFSHGDVVKLIKIIKK